MQAAGEPRFAIIGAGMSGLLSAIKLREAGLDFTVFEKAERVGGTWRENTYPGIACDVPSHVYSFSFEQKSDWSRAFAESGEIQEYLLGLVEKWQLRSHLRLDTEIVSARFDEPSATWTLGTDDDACRRALLTALPYARRCLLVQSLTSLWWNASCSRTTRNARST